MSDAIRPVEPGASDEPAPRGRTEIYWAEGPGAMSLRENHGTINLTKVLQVSFQPPQDVTAHPDLVLLPGRRNRAFMGRDPELARLRAELCPQTSGDAPAVMVVHGVGGTGKSALALEYAHRHRGAHNPVVHLSADSPESITAGLAALADALTHTLRQSDASVETRAGWAKGWLQCHGGWLLLVDDVQQPEDVAQLLGSLGGRGAVLITTRQAADWERHATVLALDVLAEEAAVGLLHRLTGHGPDTPELRELASRLDRLPLALEQAAAYIEQTRTGPAGYLRLLSESPAEALGTTALGSSPERTIARVWHHTMRAVDREHPHAVHLMRVLAWFAPHGIPREILKHLRPDTSRSAGRRALMFLRRLAHSTGLLQHHRTMAGRRLAPADIDGALAVLRSYGLVHLADDTVAVHSLMQTVARTPVPGDSYRSPGAVRAARNEVAELLAQAGADNPLVPGNWLWWQTVAPQIEAFLTAVPRHVDDVWMVQVLWSMVGYLSDSERPASDPDAVLYAERAVHVMQRRLIGGRLHPATRGMRVQLAQALERSGRADEALVLLEGPRWRAGVRPAMLTRRRLALAQCYLQQGRFGEVPPLLVHEYHHRHLESVGGGLRRDALKIRGLLAEAYWKAGRRDQAVALYEETLWRIRRAVGDRSPVTLWARHSLACAYAGIGEPARAVDLHEQTLAVREQMFGEHSAVAFHSRLALAYAHEVAGDVEAAISLLERNVALTPGVLSGDSPVMTASRRSLAALMLRRGDVDGAMVLHAANVTDTDRTFGPHHREVQLVRRDFALDLLNAGHPESAAPLIEEALRGFEDAAGPMDRETIKTRHLLAFALRLTGPAARAVALHEQALGQAKTVLPPEDPLILTMRLEGAYAYQENGDLDRAAHVLEGVAREADARFGGQDWHRVEALQALRDIQALRPESG
ncbi:tetratricopeptide repeat protein [Streptomyces parvus]|uniref:tetratricopeptide repeat protein n=1 Tax=Streptomyces parvus TaxID=66428 RepID=UPI0035D6867C